MTGAPFPYPGSKARHADWIVDYLPAHTSYVEPFGGAAGVLFSKPKSKMEVYNDRNGDLVQFFEVLRERPDDLIEWLDAVPYSRELYESWATDHYDHGHRPDDPVERAGRFYTLRYMQFGGKIDSKAGFATGSKPGGPTTGQFANSIPKLKEFAKRLQTVVIENRDWREIVDVYDTPDTVFYCDPPYPDTEEYYDGGLIDHQELHDKLLDADAAAVVSYDAVPEFYGTEWRSVSKNSAFNIDNTGGSESKETTEILLMDYDPESEPKMRRQSQSGLETFADGGSDA